MTTADRLVEIFNEARALPGPAERERFLAETCPGETELQDQVRSLLRAHEAAGDFLEATPPLLEAPGDKIGRYRLLEQIGEGGCGVVYMAEQEEPVRRRVALKVIKLGMDTRHVVARFEAERQALALMDHPNIAKVLDGGATSAGRPFFVMELVRGTRITEYCDENGLSTGERMGLFLQVCQAVQHAHQKGVIHRDIKPSNILVTVLDGAAVPKVIDFGIAKTTTGQPLTDRTLFTAFQQFVGTPAYMSPEQAECSGADVDTRSDIYSLGVLLYELLTGRPPFDPETLLASGLDEIRRTIREEEPPKPSTRLGSLDRASLTAVAARRRTGPPGLIHLIRGDLDWIVMKCLEKDRARRYASASDVALDIQRHVDGHAVLACPPSAAYRFRKFARRNRVALATAMALALAVLVAVLGLVVNYRIVRRERDQKDAALGRAVEEKERADQNLSRAREAVKQYLLRTSESPLLQSGDFQALRKELLETAIPFYEEFVRQDREDPALELERGLAYDDLGFVRQGIGDPDRALSDIERAQGIYGRLLERFPEDPTYRLRLAESCNTRGGILDQLGRLEAAELEFRRGLALLDPPPKSDSAAFDFLDSRARVDGNLGLLLKETGRLPEAESMLRRAVETRTMLLERQPTSLPHRGQLAHSWSSLGLLLRALGRDEEAKRAFEAGLGVLDPEVVKQVAGGSPEPVGFRHKRSQLWNNLGTALNEAGRFADAERSFRQSIAVKEELCARFPSVPQYRQDLAATLNNLGGVLASLARSDDARGAYERAIQLYERLAADSPSGSRYVVLLAGTYTNLGRLIGDIGQTEESLPWLIQAVDILEAALEPDPRVTKVRESLTIARWARAITLAGLGRSSEALEDWDRAIELDDGRYVERLRTARASNLLNLKDHVRATADAEAVAGSPTAKADDLYNAACIYAVSAGLVPEDPSLAEVRAKRAVQILRRAMAAGYSDAEHTAADPDLEALRAREDFQAFLTELREKAAGAAG